jgi:hypothetical protein
MSDPGFASLGPSLLARKGGAKPAMRPQVAPLVTDESEIAELADDQLEDLGWNDMGHDDETDSDFEGGADIVPINADVSADHIATGPGPIVRRQQRRLEERVLADAAMIGPDDRDTEYDEAEDDNEDDNEALYGEALYGEDADSEALDDEQDYGSLAPEPAPVALIARKRMVSVQPEAAPAPAPRAVPAPTVQAGRRAAFTLRLDADRHLKLRLAATMQGVSAQALVTEALDALLAEFDDLDVIANHLKRH